MSRKPLEVVAREYMYLRDSHPLNKHICQIYNTIRYYGCAQEEAVIQEIQEGIAKAKLDIDKYENTDWHYAQECKERIAYAEDFLRRTEEEVPAWRVAQEEMEAI